MSLPTEDEPLVNEEETTKPEETLPVEEIKQPQPQEPVTETELAPVSSQTSYEKIVKIQIGDEETESERPLERLDDKFICKWGKKCEIEVRPIEGDSQVQEQDGWFCLDGQQVLTLENHKNLKFMKCDSLDDFLEHYKVVIHEWKYELAIVDEKPLNLEILLAEGGNVPLDRNIDLGKLRLDDKNNDFVFNAQDLRIEKKSTNEILLIFDCKEHAFQKECSCSADLLHELCSHCKFKTDQKLVRVPVYISNELVSYLENIPKEGTNWKPSPRHTLRLAKPLTRLWYAVSAFFGSVPNISDQLAEELDACEKKVEDQKDILKRHRLLAYSNAPMYKRIQVLRRLIAQNPKFFEWQKDLELYIQFYYDQLSEEVPKVTKLSVITQIEDEINNVSKISNEILTLSANAPTSLMMAVQARKDKLTQEDAQKRREILYEDLKKIVAVLTASFQKKYFPACEEAFNFWNICVEKLKELDADPPQELQRRAQEPLKWIRSEKARIFAENEYNKQSILFEHGTGPNVKHPNRQGTFHGSNHERTAEQIEKVGAFHG